MTYQSEVLADSPAGFWLCTETSGTTLADSSGNGQTLAIPAGVPTFAQSGPSTGTNAILWPSSAGATEFYAISNGTITGASTVTLEAWVYLSANPANNTPILSFAVGYGSNGHDRLLRIRPDGKPEYMVYTGGTNATSFTGATALALNQWHHVVASNGSSGVSIRVDKVSSYTSTASTVSADSSAKFLIHGSGDNAASRNINGGEVSIALPAVYKTRLSDARTDAHYDALVAPSGGSSAISLAGTLPAIQGVLTLSSYTDTATGNRANGRLRNGGFVDESEAAVEAPPVNLVRATKVDKALAYPTPTLVDGRPT